MACEGALIVVDASQGVEAQTVANLYLALEYDLSLLPVINKIDLPAANVDRVREEIDADLVSIRLPRFPSRQRLVRALKTCWQASSSFCRHHRATRKRR